MKIKKTLPFLLTVMLIFTAIPPIAYAEDNSQPADSNAESSVSTEAVQETGQNTEVTQKDSDTESEALNSNENEETATDESSETASSSEPTEETAADQEDSSKVVTLGENLSQAQRDSMYQYFGTSADQVDTIIVTHSDEVKYMEGIATAEQIGSTTNSCAYVEPTDSGGIKVKTANLNFVTSAMIASTLTTAGMENCNVIAACPFEVSGTGALTGIIMAYETASGENLDEGKKEAAMEELITTGDLADSIGQEKATEVVNDVKTEVIDKNLTDASEIQNAVEEIAKDNDVQLTDDQKAQITALMEKISQYDYDLNALKDTLDNLSGELSGLAGIWNSIKSFFVGSGNGILNDTNEAILGSDVITDSTVDESGFKDGLWTRIKNFFSGSDE